MARRDKEIFLTLSAIGAAGLLVYFLNGPSPAIESGNFSRARRDIDAYANTFCFGDNCQADDFDDVDMFQALDCTDDANASSPYCMARRRKKGAKGKGKPSVPEVDYSNFWKEAGAKDQINELNTKASALLDRWHRNNDFASLAAISPDVSQRDFSSFELSGPSMDVFSSNVENGGNDCALDAPNRVSEATQSMFFVFPKDMMYDSSVDQDSLMASYRTLGSNLASYAGDNTRFVVGSYSSTGKSSVVETDAANAGAAIDGLQTGFNVPTRMLKGKVALKVAQMKMKSFLGAFTAPGIRNKYFRRSDDGTAQSCQAYVVLHGLPTDYKDFSSAEFDMDAYNKRCNIVPIFVQQAGMEAYYANWAANWRSSNQMFSSAEHGFRGYVMTTASDLNANAQQMANHLTSFACACESRSACLLAKPAFVEEIEDESALTTAATTTEGTTTSAFSTSGTTTTEFTTTADFRGVQDTTEEIPVDHRCCGYSGDLGAAKYDQNREFCCNDGSDFFVSSEVC